MRSEREQRRIDRGAAGTPAVRKGIDVKSYADGDVQALRVRAVCAEAREARRS
jgi:hypothetical protein